MLQKSSVSITAEIFFETPTKTFSLAEISRSTKLAHTSTKVNLTQLLKSGLIAKKVEKKGTRNFPCYVANRDHVEFRRNKVLFNLSSLMASELVEYIENALSPKSIVLFGSYRRGEDIETSDIDLFIESKKEEINLNSFEKKLKRKIQLHWNYDFKKYPDELKNNIINGIVLHGFLEGYP